MKRIALVSALLLCGGCAVYEKMSTPPLDPPPATVKAVRVIEQTEEGAQLEIVIDLKNPNTTALPLVGASYTLSVGGASTSLSGRPNRTLPASGAQTIYLRAAVPSASARGASTHASGTISYEPPGEIRKLLTESSVPLPSTSFQYTGTVQ